MERRLDILFEDEILVEEMRIIEVDPSNQLNGVVPPLAHAPDRWNSHGEEKKPLHPLGPLCNSMFVEDAFRSAVLMRKGLQNVVGNKLVRNRIGSFLHRDDLQ
jgi:hypothetical protein